MRRARYIALLTPLLALALSAGDATKTAEAATAGPASAKCGKLARKAARRRCLAQNRANRIAFNQIKNSHFAGVRGDGEEVMALYCASGRYESRSAGSSGTAVSTGRSWRIKDALVRQGGKWIDAFLAGEGGYEIALQRRGDQWRYGVASLGRILYPGNVVKTAAAAECAAGQS